MANPKVCIKSGNSDLLRIIPFPVNNEYDFKISLINNDFTLRLHPESFDHFFLLPKEFDLKNWEITYHNSTLEKPAKVHLKSLTKPTRYETLPLINFADLVKTSNFPIPLLKIGFSFSDSFKTYRSKTNYCVIDIDKNNENI